MTPPKDEIKKLMEEAPCIRECLEGLSNPKCRVVKAIKQAKQQGAEDIFRKITKMINEWNVGDDLIKTRMRNTLLLRIEQLKKEKE